MFSHTETPLPMVPHTGYAPPLWSPKLKIPVGTALGGWCRDTLQGVAVLKLHCQDTYASSWSSPQNRKSKLDTCLGVRLHCVCGVGAKRGEWVQM